MPLRKVCSIDAYRENVRDEIADGRDPSQAAAIAHSTLRDACRAENKPVPRMDSADRETVERYDFTPIGKPTKTPQGFLRFPANLTRTGVLIYKKADGTIQRELREPSEVFNADSLATLAGAPVTDLHSAMINTKNVREFSVGIVGETVKHNDRMVQGHVTVMDQTLIDKIDAGERKEGSPGYSCWLDWTPGEFNGERYDAIQRDIKYNHWAVGPAGWGRQGNEVALRLDGNAAASSLDQSIPANNPEPNRENETMTVKRMIKIDGIDYDLDSDAGQQAVNRFIEKTDADATAAKAKNDELQGKLDASEKKSADLQKKLDETNDPATLDKRVNERADLLSNARKVLGDDAKFDGKSTREIKVEVLKKLDDKFDDKDREDAYISGLFDQSVKDYSEETREDGTSALRSATPNPGSTKRTDAKGDDKEEDKYDSAAAEKRMKERNQNAWKDDNQSAA